MEISGIFQSACILSIAGTGLAAFLWWFKASRKLDLPPGELVDFFSSARFTTFLQMIYTFEALTLKPKITDTWMFSRLLRDDAWANFTIPRVPFPVAICVAVTVDGDRSDGTPHQRRGPPLHQLQWLRPLNRPHCLRVV
uniref:Putative secreted protein n=1 Tax=Lutzomyia longipalpis TaxID=7200 RepID=A0A7G3ANL4_LUTLO